MRPVRGCGGGDSKVAPGLQSDGATETRAVPEMSEGLEVVALERFAPSLQMGFVPVEHICSPAKAGVQFRREASNACYRAHPWLS